MTGATGRRFRNPGCSEEAVSVPKPAFPSVRCVRLPDSSADLHDVYYRLLDDCPPWLPLRLVEEVSDDCEPLREPVFVSLDCALRELSFDVLPLFALRLFED